MTTTTELETLYHAGEAAELQAASKSFLRFLDYVYILEPPPGRGKIKFEKWPHLVRLVEGLETNRLNVILKARQEGFSWVMAAYSVWIFRFQEGSVVLKFSRGEVESHALLSKARFIYTSLPLAWQMPLGSDSRSELSLPDNSSKIMALPSTEDAGRSETATLVIQDEADFHTYLETNYLAVKPTIDAGGQMIMGSTSNKKKSVSLFKELYRGAPGNGWNTVFWGWRLRPGRDETWYKRTQDEIPTVVLEGLTPETYMQQEYPDNAEEALAPARAAQAMDFESLIWMQEDAKRPVEVVEGVINIYEKWRGAGKYCAATDVSKGTGYDFGVSVVLDAVTGRVVADIMSNVLSTEEFVYYTDVMLERYKKPIWGIEDNGLGEAAIQAARRKGYPRLYYRTSGRNVRQIGWHTDSRSRFLLYDELYESIKARQVTVYNKDGLGQFFTLRRDGQGHISALKGAHDDYPMAVGIALQIRGQATSIGGPIVRRGRRY